VAASLLLAGLSLGQALADGLHITALVDPAYTEVQARSSGQYHNVGELGSLNFPLAAKAAGNGALEFQQGGETWAISRADVVLADEKLVVDACSTIPATLPGDARSASVKGAGEGCK
jgi:hypothetical protein